MKERTVSFHTLGCKLNYSETSTIARQLTQYGFRRAGKGELSEVCIVNTCSVTEHADKKCRNLIRRLSRANPDAIIVVTGCYAQLKPAEIASIEGVDLVAGNDAKHTIAQTVASLATRPKNPRALVSGCESLELAGFFASFSTGERTRAFLKVQDGCDYKCSYCTIPYARGTSRNPSIELIAEQAKKIAESGQKEIVLTGINTGDFGRSTGETFTDLLLTLSRIEGIERYRISSIEPNLLSDEVIGIVASHHKFMPHFHIPLQSGTDRILALMRRRYTSASFADRIKAVREKIPHAFIGIDVIIGFPGETDDDFTQTLDFLRSTNPSFLHIFPFSARTGTPAANFKDRVPSMVIAERVAQLKEFSDAQHEKFCVASTGSSYEVLFESTIKGGMMTGFTPNYIKVCAPYRREDINRMCTVQLTGPYENGMMRAAQSEK